jgi:hypothetical protein
VFGTALTTMYLINLPQRPQFPEKVSMKIQELRFRRSPYRVLRTGSDSWNPSSVEGSVRSGIDILSPLIPSTEYPHRSCRRLRRPVAAPNVYIDTQP